jgi:hypothetical protein
VTLAVGDDLPVRVGAGAVGAQRRADRPNDSAGRDGGPHTDARIDVDVGIETPDHSRAPWRPPIGPRESIAVGSVVPDDDGGDPRRAAMNQRYDAVGDGTDGLSNVSAPRKVPVLAQVPQAR